MRLAKRLLMGAGGLALTAVLISLAVPKAAHGVVAVLVPVTKATANPTIALDADHASPSGIGAAQEANRGQTMAIHNMPKEVSEGAAPLTEHLDATQMLRLVVGLQPPHLSEEEEFIQQLHTKDSPQFHQFLTADQWNARFAPAPEDEQAVVDWAQSQGLTVTKRYPHRLIIDFEAPAGTIEKAFSVKLNRYELGSNTYFSNDRDPAIPTSLGGIVHSIAGMNNMARMLPAGRESGASAPSPLYVPGPVSRVSGAIQGDAGAPARAVADVRPEGVTPEGVTPDITFIAYTPEMMWGSNAYDTQALYNQGHCCNPLHVAGGSPRESSIAIAGAFAVDPNDVVGFHNNFPYLAYNVTTVDVDGTSSCPSGQPNCADEITLDTEWSLAMSNSRGSANDTAKVWVYQGVDGTAGTFEDAFSNMLNDDVARVMSTSFGCAEFACVQQSDMDTIHNTFNMMVGEGWTLVAAAGDNGAVSTTYVNNAKVCLTYNSVSYPGSDPDVVSAGGTTLDLKLPSGAYVSEVAWTGNTFPGSCASNNGGGGGGCSGYYPRPGYQTNADCLSTTGFNRSTPDIALNASSSQYYFFQGSLQTVGGTSIVAPELAGFFAQENAYLDTFGSICGINTGTSPCAPVGLANYPIYAAGNPGNPPHYPFYDILYGCNSNDITAAFPIEIFCAGPGYDQATGWGSVNMLQLAWAINYNLAADTGRPDVKFSGPTTHRWYHKNRTVRWTVTDTGGGFTPTGVGGFSQAWNADPGDVTIEATPGEGNSFYDGPQFPNRTKGSLNLDDEGQGCHTANVEAWDNMGLQSFDRTYGPLCYDTIPPVTTDIVFPAADSYGWNNSTVLVIFTAKDPGAPTTGSGVAHTYYSVDDPFCITINLSPCTVYERPFEIKTEGQHNVYVLSEDVAGNFEERITIPVNIDETAPVTTASLSGALSGGFHVAPVKVTLTSTDNLSGVASTVYQVNGGPVQTYTGAFNVSNLGADTVTFHSTDKAGNVEAQKSVSFTIEASK